MSKEVAQSKDTSSQVSLDVGDKVRKSKGKDVGETGTVLLVDHESDDVTVKVSPDNEELKWNKQLASNFDLVSRAKKVSSSKPQTTAAATTSGAKDEKQCAQGGGGGGRTEATYEVGDKVKKISGANAGETGIVAEVVYDGNKEEIKVEPDNQDLRAWPKQSSSNFELISRPKKSGDKSRAITAAPTAAGAKDALPPVIKVTFEVGDKVKKLNGKDAGEVGTVVEMEDEGEHLTVKVSPDNELSKGWARQNAENYTLFEKAKKQPRKKNAEEKRADEKKLALDGRKPESGSEVSLDVGDKVRKSKGKDVGETGTVLLVDHESDDVTVKVSPDNEELKWNKQLASNFDLVSRAKKVSSKTQTTAAASTTAETKDKAAAVAAVVAAAAERVSFEVGDKVKKISGANAGETGIVAEVVYDGNKEEIKVEPDNQDLRAWTTQSSSNFELISRPKKGGGKPRTVAAATAAAATKVDEQKGGGGMHTDLNFEVGDKVKKIKTGETGIVAEIFHDGDKETIKVEPDNHELRWPKQSAANFELLKESEKEPEILSNSKEFNYSAYPAYPVEFTEKTLIEMPERNGDTFIYRGEKYSAAEWAKKLTDYERKYPNIVKGGKKGKTRDKTATAGGGAIASVGVGGVGVGEGVGDDDSKEDCKAQSVAPFETVKYRTKQTTNESIIEDCWNDARYVNRFHPAFKGIPNTFLNGKWRDMFRVDMYGNVISIDASDGALCKFDVDHIFPWSRGGKSSRANFAGVHWSANRSVKSDSMIMALSPESMRVGLMPEQFRALFDYSTSKDRGQRRNVRFCTDTVFRYWLLSGPVKGATIADFRTEVGGSTDGAVLWNFFERHFNQQQEVAVVKVKFSHQIYFRTIGSLIECFGDIGEVGDEDSSIPALLALGFRYNAETQSLSTRITKNAERDALVRSVEDWCRQKSFTLIQLIF